MVDGVGVVAVDDDDDYCRDYNKTCHKLNRERTSKSAYQTVLSN